MNILFDKHRNTRFYSFLSILLLIGLTVCLSGCKTTQKTATSAEPEAPRCLSARVQLTIPFKGDLLTVNGTLKLISGERVQLSFLMPILRSEMVRLEVTPDDVLLIDRMGKRYVQVSREEVKNLLPKKADFAHLEKLLFRASERGGKSTLTGKELGITSMAKAQIVLSDFSHKEFTLTPAVVSAKYAKMEWSELLKLLMKL